MKLAVSQRALLFLVLAQGECKFSKCGTNISQFETSVSLTYRNFATTFKSNRMATDIIISVALAASLIVETTCREYRTYKIICR